MIRSHLMELFLAHAWNLHGPVWDRISDMLQAHASGRDAKQEWRDRAALSLLDFGEQEAPEEDAQDAVADGLAIIAVRGVLALHADQVNGDCQPQGRSFDSIQEQIAAAVADPSIRAIVLRLETPGGTAVGCAETYDAITAASTVKPVHAFVDGYAYSAGYYLAAACDSITASSESAGVGSIGTIMSLWDTSSAQEQAGIRRVVVRAGVCKAPAQNGERIDSAQLAELQRVVNAYGAAFHDAVRAGRGLTDEQAGAVLNGRTFLASEAQGLGLIDGIASFTDFIAGLCAGETPMLFGKKKTAPTCTTLPQADAFASAIEPAAHAAAKEDQPMLTAMALAALVAAESAHASLIAQLAKDGKDESAILSAVADAKAKASAEAAAKRLEELTNKLAASEKALADEKAAHAKTAADLAKVQAHSTPHGDPGPGNGSEKRVRTCTTAEFGKMNAEQREQFTKDGGLVVG